MSEHLAPFGIIVEHIPLELEEKSHQACDCPLTLALAKLDQLTTSVLMERDDSN